MEFYENLEYDFYSIDSRFNSQRDGILLKGVKTHTSRLCVSIPNGMEFYFNVVCIFYPFCIVSIPNGMEFYPFFDCVARHFWKFQFPTGWNSTGKWDAVELENTTFQFPTGWNSTKTTERIMKPSTNVSIPNGMEFYSFHILGILIMYGSFNSQRDGILQHELCHFSR